MKNKYRTRALGGSLLVIKSTNDCVTIERGADSKPRIVSVEGAWTAEELTEAGAFWPRSEAARR